MSLKRKTEFVTAFAAHTVALAAMTGLRLLNLSSSILKSHKPLFDSTYIHLLIKKKKSM